jgi:hypothetical protein
MARRKKRRHRPVNLGSVSKKDFESVAATLCRYKAPPNVAEELALYFEKQNTRFSRTRFLEATKKC